LHERVNVNKFSASYRIKCEGVNEPFVDEFVPGYAFNVPQPVPPVGWLDASASFVRTRDNKTY